MWIEAGRALDGVKFPSFCASREFSQMIALETQPASRTPILTWLAVSQGLALLSLIFWLYVAVISFMAFDSGASRLAWTFVIAVWSYPVWPIAFIIFAWIAYDRKKDKLAAVLSTLTFLPILVLILILFLPVLFQPSGL